MDTRDGGSFFPDLVSDVLAVSAYFCGFEASFGGNLCSSAALRAHLAWFCWLCVAIATISIIDRFRVHIDRM